MAAVSSGLSAFFLMVGAAIWTSIISKDSWLKQVKVQGSVALGITVTAGPALCKLPQHTSCGSLVEDDS